MLSLAAFSSGESARTVELAGRADAPASRQAKEPVLAERPTMFAHSVEINFFEDLATMAATSDLVVLGEVRSVRPGRWVGEEEPKGRERVRDVTIEIEEVLLNNGSGAAPKTVTVDEWGWDSRGVGFQDENVTWTKAGDRGYYFLTPVKDAPGHHRLINSQGRALISGTELTPSSEEGAPLHEEMHHLSPKGFENSLSKAIRDIRAGKVRPQKKP
ncbi:hypothetical protein [Actinomadura viridis]|uniref:Uncharacterized protein n=1 Tax=Actinomadura viridis TaxID=58110 RepID=A0A931DN42_9ACTN|nr:hypothetical protein [Actinomadura viridis]MBG6091689.1 hypothetical protein [Actinomadura viridis]